MNLFDKGNKLKTTARTALTQKKILKNLKIHIKIYSWLEYFFLDLNWKKLVGRFHDLINTSRRKIKIYIFFVFRELYIYILKIVTVQPATIIMNQYQSKLSVSLCFIFSHEHDQTFWLQLQHSCGNFIVTIILQSVFALQQWYKLAIFFFTLSKFSCTELSRNKTLHKCDQNSHR